MKGPFSHIYKLGLENKGEDLIFIYNVEPTTSKTIREYVKRML